MCTRSSPCQSRMDIFNAYLSFSLAAMMHVRLPQGALSVCVDSHFFGADRGVGTIIGEMALFNGGLRSASMIATQEVRVCPLPQGFERDQTPPYWHYLPYVRSLH